MSSHSSREKKQEYLFQEIIQKGYDGNAFFNFITNIKDDGANVDVWHFDDLKKIVQQFIHDQQEVLEDQDISPQKKIADRVSQQIQEDAQYQNQEQFQNQEQQNEEQQQQKSHYLEGIKDDNNNPQQQNYVNQDQIYNPDILQQKQLQQQQNDDQQKQNEGFEFMEQIGTQERYSQQIQLQQIYLKKYGISEDPINTCLKCQKNIPVIPKQNKIRIFITDPQKQDGYLFGLAGNYILFKIATKPYNWEVQRRMTDFITYRSIISKLFPGILIPPLDPNLKENNQIEIAKRMKFLNNFVNDIRNIECIWYHPYTISFFSDSKPDWDKNMKSGEKERIQDKIKSNLTGEIPISFTNDNYEYKEELDSFITLQENNYSKLYLISKQLQKDFENTSNTLSEMSKLYFNLFQDINDFTGRVVVGQQSHKKLSDSYYIYGQMFENWSQYMSKSIAEVKNLTNQYKYSFQETKSQRDLFKGQTDAENIFIKYQQVYDEKKQEEQLLKQQQQNQQDGEGNNNNAQQQQQQQNKKVKKINNEMQTYYIQLKEEYGYWVSQLCNESQRLYQKKGSDNLRFLQYICKAEASKTNEMMQSWGDLINPYIKNPFPIPREQVAQIKQQYQNQQIGEEN